MEPQTLENLLNKVEGRYKLVSLYQKRTRELLRGLPPLVEADAETSQKEIVANEILSGKVELLVGDDAQQYRKEMAAKEESADEAVKALEAAAPAPSSAAPETVEPAPAPAPEAEAAVPAAEVVETPAPVEPEPKPEEVGS